MRVFKSCIVFTLVFCLLIFAAKPIFSNHNLVLKGFSLSDSIPHIQQEELPFSPPIEDANASSADSLPNTSSDSIPKTIEPADLAEEQEAKSVVNWYTEDQLANPFLHKPNYVDTTLLNFAHYDFASKNHFLIARKGNVGHAHRSLIFAPDVKQKNSFSLSQPWGSYVIHHDDLQFYRPKYVFTDLYYVMAGEQEQLFHAKHAQKLNEQLHYSFLFRIINAPGVFTRIAAVNTNLYFTADYLSPNKRYQGLASIISNRIQNNESKGIANPERYAAGRVNDSVYLSDANARYRDFSVNLRQYYQTGFYIPAREDEEQKRFVNLGRVHHGFTYGRSSFIFEDAQEPSPFFDYEPPSPEHTFDSTIVHRIENTLSWENFPSENARLDIPFNFKLYLKYNFNAIQQPTWPEGVAFSDTLGQPLYYHSRNTYNELIQGIELNTDPDMLLSIGGYANVTIGGYNDEDLHAGAHLNLGKESRSQFFNAQIHYSLSEVPYFLNTYSGNYISYDNNFQKNQIINLIAELDLKYIELEGRYYLMENMVYLNSDALPVQNESLFSFAGITAKSDLEYGIWGLRNHVGLQESSTRRFDNYPTLVSYHSVYGHFSMFDKALYNQIGVDFYYNTDYYAMSYMPMLRSFYRQNEHLLKDQFRLDAYWSGKISNARLFIKFENLLDLLPGQKPYYTIPFYPFAEPSFKFGVSWMFFN